MFSHPHALNRMLSLHEVSPLQRPGVCGLWGVVGYHNRNDNPQVRDAMPESMDDKVLSGKTRAVDANILATIPKSVSNP